MLIVKEDLDFLTKEWNQDIDQASIRRAVGSLSQLLIENKLQKTASFYDLKIRIMKPSYEDDEDSSFKGIRFYAALGVKYNGAEIKFIKEYPRALTEQEIKQKYQKIESHKKVPIKLTKFLYSPAFYYKDTLITRTEVLKYVRNKLGGVHYDRQRNINKTLEKKYVLLDNIREAEYEALGMDIVFLEVLSIGQRVVNSRDVQKLRKKLNKYLIDNNVL